MALAVAIQMDPLATLRPQTDTSLLLAEEAMRRGHTVHYYTPSQLRLESGLLRADARELVFDGQWREGAAEALALDDADVVLMRQDPPFDMAYITATYLLESLKGKALVVNDPAAVRNHPEKLFPLQFPQFVPPTLITRDMDAIRAFHREQKEIVLKPLYAFGGQGVFHIGRDARNLEALLEQWLATSREPLLAQLFLPEVSRNERRIVLIDGKVAGAFARTPAEGEIRSNMRVGGEAVAAELTARQRVIAEEVGEACRVRGLLLVGLDVIGDYLTEINVTSPTGLRALKKLYGTTPECDFWDAVEAKL